MKTHSQSKEVSWQRRDLAVVAETQTKNQSAHKADNS